MMMVEDATDGRSEAHDTSTNDEAGTTASAFADAANNSAGSSTAGEEGDSGMDGDEEYLPASLRDSLDELVAALRNVVRTQPLAVAAAAAGVAYVAGRIASRKH